MKSIILASEPSNGLIMLLGMIGFTTYGMAKASLWLLPITRSPKWSKRISRIALIIGIFSLGGGGIRHAYWKHQPPRFVITHQPYLYPPVADSTIQTNGYGWRYRVWTNSPSIALLAHHSQTR